MVQCSVTSILTMGTPEEVCIRCRDSGEVLDVPYSCAEEGAEVGMAVILYYI